MGCEDSNCSLLSADIRSKFPVHLPARLLIDPLISHFKHVVDTQFPKSIEALLQMVGSMASNMDPSAVATYKDQAFMFFLSALNLRHSGNMPFTVVCGIEDTCVAAFLCFVMKLNERQFRPLFTRLLEWSEGMGKDLEVMPVPEGRKVAFYHVISALVQRLRSMFTPYFKHVLQPMATILETHKPATTKAAQKKQQEEVPLLEKQTTYRLRLYIVRSLHRCFLYDNTGLMDQEQLSNIFPLLVSQIRGRRPSDEIVGDLLECIDKELEGGLGISTDKDVDPLGISLVGCLAQLAVTGGSDSIWRPLNRKVSAATKIFCSSLICCTIRR